jgi:multidrug efflux pump subunit AcrA (membrane-fusion protein)
MNVRKTICISILVWGICLTFPACRKSTQNNDLCIQKGFFQATLTESGELLALNARSVLMPYVGWQYGGRFKLTGLVEHGTQVHKGDSVAQVDPANVYKFLLEQENLLEVEKANLAKLLVEQSIRSRELDANLKEIQADYNLKKLELERFKFESERKNEIKKLEFGQATVHLERIQRTIELERTISANSLKIQKIKVAQIESNIHQARNAVKKLTIRSPIDGMFQVSKSRMTNQLYKVGDDTYQGAELALVPDLSLIKVKSTINEADFGKVRIGQKVIVRLEAFPDRPFHGRITDLGKLSYKKEEDSNIKIFDSEIILDESDPVLKPGMTVSCEIFYAELEDVFYVDNQCLRKVDGTFYLRIKGKEGWLDQQVEIGPRNNKFTVIYGDFRQGTELMLPQGEIMAGLDKKVTVNKAF